MERESCDNDHSRDSIGRLLDSELLRERLFSGVNFSRSVTTIPREDSPATVDSVVVDENLGESEGAR